MTDLFGGDHLWPGPVCPEVDGGNVSSSTTSQGQDFQHYRQSYGGRSQQLCGGGHVHIHDGDDDELGSVRAGFTEECRTPGLEISQVI